MKTYILILILLALTSGAYSQLQIEYALAPDMSYTLSIKNTSKEQLLTQSPRLWTAPSPKRNGEFIKVNLGRFDSIDSCAFIRLKEEKEPLFQVNEKKEFNGNLRIAVQDWGWDSDSVKYAIFECNIPYISLSSGQTGVYNQKDTLRLGKIKPEFARIPVKWKIVSTISENTLHSRITNLMDVPVHLYLTADETIVRSTAHIYNFDRNKWTFTSTSGIFELGKRLLTVFSPGETKEYHSRLDYPQKLTGIFFIKYRLIYAIPSTFTYGKMEEEVVLLQNPLVDEDGKSIEKIYWEVDKAPEFPGGDEALAAFFKNRIENIHQEIGSCILKVIIEKDGSISFPFITSRKNILRLDEKILKVVKKIPKWSPAYVNGKPVRAFHDIKIKFP